ncbi:MAG: hypothetical protein KDI80_15075 [Xanthomonadales bacterium]|nr:hypothetical protein [Xanthomonadales bacterium]
MEFVVAIPARFGSQRLPGKPLLPIAGVPMIVHVAQRALLAGARDLRCSKADGPLDLALIALGFGDGAVVGIVEDLARLDDGLPVLHAEGADLRTLLETVVGELFRLDRLAAQEFDLGFVLEQVGRIGGQRTRLADGCVRGVELLLLFRRPGLGQKALHGRITQRVDLQGGILARVRRADRLHGGDQIGIGTRQGRLFRLAAG